MANHHDPDFDQFIAGQLQRAAPPTDYTLDCFVSSEVGYNGVIERCMPASDEGPRGAYLGVGPDQNYTYIGALRPELAIILDARIDNLLEHLLFKLLFEEARDPLDYLCLLLGRRRPDNPVGEALAAADLLARLRAQPIDQEEGARHGIRVRSVFQTRWGASEALLLRVERLRQEFARRQLRVTSVSERCLANLDQIPDFEQVITATTPEGFNFHYLTDAARFAHVKELHRRDRILLILGNVTDPAAIRQARAALDESGLRLSAVYLSNLEEFLLQRYVIEQDRITRLPNPAGLLEGEALASFERLVEQLAALPCEDDAVLIRFFFPGVHRGRQLGVFPWLASHVSFLHDFLRRYRQERPASVLATYV